MGEGAPEEDSLLEVKLCGAGRRCWRACRKCRWCHEILLRGAFSPSLDIASYSTHRNAVLRLERST